MVRLLPAARELPARTTEKRKGERVGQAHRAETFIHVEGSLREPLSASAIDLSPLLAVVFLFILVLHDLGVVVCVRVCMCVCVSVL